MIANDSQDRKKIESICDNGKEITEDRIKERAYFIWHDEGRPEGCHVEHWLVAERELKGLPFEVIT